MPTVLIAEKLKLYYIHKRAICPVIIRPAAEKVADKEEIRSLRSQKRHELGIAAGVSSEYDSHQEGAQRFIRAIRELEQLYEKEADGSVTDEH